MPTTVSCYNSLSSLTSGIQAVSTHLQMHKTQQPLLTARRTCERTRPFVAVRRQMYGRRYRHLLSAKRPTSLQANCGQIKIYLLGNWRGRSALPSSIRVPLVRHFNGRHSRNMGRHVAQRAQPPPAQVGKVQENQNTQTVHIGA